MLLKMFLSWGVMLAVSASCAMAQTSPVFSPGEKLVYQIRRIMMNVGEMILVYEGPVVREGRELLLLTLSVRALKFTGDDKIYLDPQTFLPVTVERDIVFMGKKEWIREEYDAERGMVEIIKTVDGETTTQTITKEGPLENIYGFIFRYRRDGRLDQDQDLDIRLPTQDVTMSYGGLRTIDANGQKVNAHYLESSPKAYRIWLDPSERKIPLRIDGTAGFGSTAMVLKEYVAGHNDPGQTAALSTLTSSGIEKKSQLDALIQQEADLIRAKRKLPPPLFAGLGMEMSPAQWQTSLDLEEQRLSRFLEFIQHSSDERLPEDLVSLFLTLKRERDAPYQLLVSFLLELGADTVPFFVQRYNATDNADKARIMETLGWIGSRAALPVIKKALDDPDPAVSSSAQTALTLILELKDRPELGLFLVETREHWELNHALPQIGIRVDDQWWSHFFRLSVAGKIELADLQRIGVQPEDCPPGVIHEHREFFLMRLQCGMTTVIETGNAGR